MRLRTDRSLTRPFHEECVMAQEASLLTDRIGLHKSQCGKQPGLGVRLMLLGPLQLPLAAFKGANVLGYLWNGDMPRVKRYFFAVAGKNVLL